MPTTRFTDRAENYRKHRPDYPAAAIDAVLESLGDPSRLAIADIGAGTGISARMLAERGARVVAIEPNAAMRAAADPDPRISWRDGAAEGTGLEGGSVDVVVCAQAFHWFRQAEAVREFHRVLAPGGRLALVWNGRDRSDPATLAYVEAIHAVNGEDPVEKRPFDPAVVHGDGLFTVPELVSFPHQQRVDLAGLIGRAASASYVPQEGEAFDRLRELLALLHARHRDAEGFVVLRYVTKVYRATRR